MNQSPILRRLGSAAVALCLLAGVCAGTAACSESDGYTPGTTAETEAVTLPDLSDDRELTDVSDYAERLEIAFAENTPVPVADLTYTVADDGVTVTGYTGGDVVVVIPDTVEGKPVVAIAAGAFAERGSLKALSIPASVVSIGVGALSGCDSLSTLRTPLCTAEGADYFGALFGAKTYEINAAHVPSTLSTLILTAGEAIPDYAFYDCALRAVSLPASLMTIGKFAFYSNEKLAYIPLAHTGLTAVGERAFAGCSSLLALDLPASMTLLGFAMMEGCGALETLTLPFVGAWRSGTAGMLDSSALDKPEDTEENAEYLGYLFGAADFAFTAGYLPASLIRVTLLEGCGDIPPSAFFQCSSIREIILPEGVEAIGRRAFYGCTRLSSICLPDSVIRIGDDAFHGCVRLVDLTVGTGLSTLGVQVFMDCMSLKTVTLPAGVTELPNGTFAGCRSLEELIAPGVGTVGAQVFRHCDKLIGWGDEERQ